MKRDSKLSGILHVLLHMAGIDGPVTSERLAAMMSTNAVVVRRIMAGLRDQGLVSSEKGHGGGWRIAKSLDTVSLADVYRAVGEPELFALGHRSDNPRCLVEQAVNAAVGAALSEAETLLMQRFSHITLADLARDFDRRAEACGHAYKEVSHDL